MYLYNKKLLLEPIFFVYIHEVHSCFQKSHQHRKWNPRVSCCTISPKMSQKNNMWCQECICYCVCYTCSDPILTYVLYYSFFFLFMSKKSKHVIVIFMVLNFDFWLQKLFSSSVKTFWSNLHFCHVTEKLMDLWLGWKCVTKLPLRAKDFLSISHNVRFQWFLPHSNKAKSLL